MDDTGKVQRSFGRFLELKPEIYAEKNQQNYKYIINT